MTTPRKNTPNNYIVYQSVVYAFSVMAHSPTEAVAQVDKMDLCDADHYEHEDRYVYAETPTGDYVQVEFDD
ncbi:MAG: hypothetical protein E6R03_15005 [Hyphomicrobiaceae bacterium]|nr:MAG: hypothetical protein E6R03_15005 [Hyphomicrobiaceae bacterium]